MCTLKVDIECHLAGVVSGATTPTLAVLGLFSLGVTCLGQLGRFSVCCEFSESVDAASEISHYTEHIFHLRLTVTMQSGAKIVIKQKNLCICVLFEGVFSSKKN